MKKIAAILLSVVVVFSLAACASPAQQAEAASSAPASAEASASPALSEAPASAEDSSPASGSGQNILIAYFSVPETDGVDTVAGAGRVAVNGEVLGNSQYIAQLIQQETGGDLFRIETVQEYPGTHDALLDFAYTELTENARPALASQIENPDNYDVIFLGYPNWNSDLPMPLYTFLETYDFSGKTIIPFATSGGSGLGDTVKLLASSCPEARFLNGRVFSPSASQTELLQWANQCS